MFILSKRYGRLCNRLFNAAHILALAIEHNHTFVNLSFYEYAEHFKATQHDIFCRYPERTGNLKSHRYAGIAMYYLSYGISATLYFLSRMGISTNWLKMRTVRPVRDKVTRHAPDLDISFLPLDYSDTSQVVFFQGWNLRCSELLKKHGDKVRAYYRPADVYQAGVRALVKEQRAGYDLLIGIVMRHGDYRRYHKGKYFYSQDKYVGIMTQLKALHSDKKVNFLLFSDEEQNTEVFKSAGLDFFFRSGHMMENLYSLAECDYIVSPPSTYGLWASFYGRKPLCVLEDPDQILTMTDSFVICEG